MSILRDGCRSSKNRLQFYIVNNTFLIVYWPPIYAFFILDQGLFIRFTLRLSLNIINTNRQSPGADEIFKKNTR